MLNKMFISMSKHCFCGSSKGVNPTILIVAHKHFCPAHPMFLLVQPKILELEFRSFRNGYLSEMVILCANTRYGGVFIFELVRNWI